MCPCELHDDELWHPQVEGPQGEEVAAAIGQAVAAIAGADLVELRETTPDLAPR